MSLAHNELGGIEVKRSGSASETLGMNRRAYLLALIEAILAAVALGYLTSAEAKELIADIAKQLLGLGD